MLVNTVFQRDELILCPRTELESSEERMTVSFDFHFNSEAPPL